jgi:molecular chaperone GrpE
LSKTLARHGVEEIVAENIKFDPNLHQALFQIPVKGVEAGMVYSVEKKGYLLKGRVLRPAQVGVVKEE